MESEGDKEYQERRNALIPEAEHHANRMAGDGKGFHCAKWNWIFHTTMNKLWKGEVMKEREGGHETRSPIL